jgi:hypothetical protein
MFYHVGLFSRLMLSNSYYHCPKLTRSMEQSFLNSWYPVTISWTFRVFVLGPGASLSCLQASATEFCPSSTESSPYHQKLLLRSILIILLFSEMFYFLQVFGLKVGVYIFWTPCETKVKWRILCQKKEDRMRSADVMIPVVWNLLNFLVFVHEFGLVISFLVKAPICQCYFKKASIKVNDFSETCT